MSSSWWPDLRNRGRYTTLQQIVGHDRSSGFSAAGASALADAKMSAARLIMPSILVCSREKARGGVCKLNVLFGTPTIGFAWPRCLAFASSPYTKHGRYISRDSREYARARMARGPCRPRPRPWVHGARHGARFGLISFSAVRTTMRGRATLARKIVPYKVAPAALLCDEDAFARPSNKGVDK